MYGMTIDVRKTSDCRNRKYTWGSHQLGRLRVRGRWSPRAQVRRCVRASVCEHESPRFTARSGTQRARNWWLRGKARV